MTARLAAACAVVAIAGCGGSSSAAESPLDRWREAADAACDRAERAIRDDEPAESVSDLERVLVGAGDHILAAVDEIRALPVPEASRAVVAPVLGDLKVVEQNVRAVRRATRTGEGLLITRAAGTLRIDVSRFAHTAKQAGLKRCGREAQGHAAADAVAMPSYAAAIAEQTRLLHEEFGLLRRYLARAGTTGGRLGLWKRMRGVVDWIDTQSANETPHRVEERDEGFSYRLSDLRVLVDDAAYFLERGNAAKARRKHAAAFRLAAKLQARGIKLLEATGAPGRKLLPDVRRALRR